MFRRLIRINKGLLALATLTTVSLLGTPQSARATLSIFLQEGSGNIVQVATTATDFSSVSFTGNFGPTGIVGPGMGDFHVAIQGGSSDNGATLSDLLSSTTSVQNISGATATLHLWVSQTNYSLPTGTPLEVESGLSATKGPTTTLTQTGIFQAYADSGNHLLSTGASGGAAITNFTNGAQTAIATANTSDTGSAFGSFARTVNSPYSLTSVANLQLSAGGTANYSDHVNVTGVPEPATTALVLAGLPVLGLVLARRRRQRA